MERERKMCGVVTIEFELILQKDEERICKEKSVSERNVWIWVIIYVYFYVVFLVSLLSL